MDPALKGDPPQSASAAIQDYRSNPITPGGSLDKWGTFTALVVIWWVALDHIRVEWSINEQYSFGWLVPCLTLYLFAVRWTRRPPPQEPKHRSAMLVLLGLLAVAWLPVHLLQVSSPDWRLIGWALNGLAVVFTLGSFYLKGGAAWFRHFSFPVCFALVAVPWPVPFEQSVIQSLMRVVAGTSVEAMRWCGFPAVQQGNVINLGSAGVVGFEEACSGVRSLQTMLMASLFLGEIWHRRLWRRLLLVVVGLFLALVCNVGRALTLSWITATYTSATASAWHDRVGMMFLGLMLGSFGLLTYLSRDRRDDTDDVPLNLEPASGASPLAISWRLSAILLGWLLTVWIGTELWYLSGEKSRDGKSEIVIHWPEKEAGFKDLPIPTRTGIILRNDEGRSATWKAENGETWSMVYLKWKAGSSAVQLARAHTPDVCLPAAGGRLDVDHGVVVVPAGGMSLPAHAYTFSAAGGPMHVFYIRLGDDAGLLQLPMDIEELTVRNRIRAALARRRNRGQQVVEVAVTSYKSAEEVAASFEQFARSAFQVSTTHGS